MINSVPYAKNMAVHTNHTILVTVTNSILKVFLSKGMGVKEVHEEMDTWTSAVKIREKVKVKIFLR